MTIKQDHSPKNAMKILYTKKYQLDKDFGFRVPKLKVDLEAYLHRLLDSVEEAFETANIVKYSGHTLKWGNVEKETDDTL